MDEQRDQRKRERLTKIPDGILNKSPNIRYIGTNGAYIERPEPAFVSKAEIKANSRARGDEPDIPEVMIYTEERAPAGMVAKPAKTVSKKEAEIVKKVEELASKSVRQLELEIVKNQLLEEERQKRNEEAMTQQSKEKEERLKRKEAVVKQEKETARFAGMTAYLEWANRRAHELQEEKQLNWKDAKALATKEYHERKKEMGYLTEAGEGTPKVKIVSPKESSDEGARTDKSVRSKKSKSDIVYLTEAEKSDPLMVFTKNKKRYAKPRSELTEAEKKIATPLLEEVETVAEEKPKKEKPGPREGTLLEIATDSETRRQKKAQATMREVETPSETSKKEAPLFTAEEKRERSRIQNMTDAELQEEYRKIYPKKTFPSQLVMINTILRSKSLYTRGGKRK